MSGVLAPQVVALRQAAREADAALARAQAEAASHQHDARTHAIRRAPRDKVQEVPSWPQT